MNTKNLVAILIILFLPICLFAFLSKSEQSFAKKQNAKNNTPQIIKFSSPMCLDCKELKKNMDIVYPNYANKIELIEIQVQDGTDFTKKQIEKYNVTLVPTVVMLDKNGKKVARYEGNIEKNKLKELMKELINE